MTEPQLQAAVKAGATLVAVYRLREDGDGDFIAAFDIENCEALFGDNSGEGAGRLVDLVMEGLTFDNEASVWIALKSLSDIVDVLTNAQELWEQQRAERIMI